MSDIEKLASKRMDRTKDSSEANVLDVLRAAAHDVEVGTIKADCVLVVFLNRPKDGPWMHDTYRANLTYDQELVALELSKAKCLHRWIFT